MQDWLWLPVLGLLAAVYLTTQLTVSEVLPGELNVLFLQPLLWLYVAALSFTLWRFGIPSRPGLKPALLVFALVLGVFQVAAWLGAGLLFGFGQSPHGQQGGVLLGNVLLVGTSLLGMEMARTCLVASLGRRSPARGIAVSAGALALVNISVGHYAALSDVPSVLSFAGQLVVPNLAQSLLASMLALIAGPGASLAYRSILVSFEWFFPLLPDLEWIAAAFFSTMPAALGLLAIEEFQVGSLAKSREASGERGDRLPLGWLFGAAAAVALLFFNSGAFGVRPTLISGPSMEPYLQAGDIAITSQVDPEQIQVGDVISFREPEGTIIHRVVAVQRDEIGLQYITRGDANNVDDPPVNPEQVLGRVTFRVPKVGWAAILLRRALQLVL